MATTETDQVVRALPSTFPTLRLLYTGGAVAASTRPLLGSVALGREVPDKEGFRIEADRRASRLHARFHLPRPGGDPEVVDEGSKNGTFVNGRRVERAVLRDGDVVRTGNSFVLLRYQPARQVDAAIEGLVGAAPAMRELRHRIAQVAGEGCAVLLLGESGTGKELCARAIHERSGRKGAFVPVNCAAIPEQLAESQLFGHLAGAFTGATQHKGFFRAAHGGTLFLDEIGEMPLTLQPKLLRAIEDQAIVPLGATAPAPCDVRLVAATHRDLPKKVEDGSFRGDLYARLAAFPVHLPPLRERREDILPLLGLQLQPRPDRPPPTLATELVEALLLYDWPFNVRELLKIAEQLRIVGQGQDTPLLDLPMIEGRLRTQAPGPDEAEPEASRPAPTREELVALLTEHQGNISHVAKITGRSRRQVDRWIRQFQLDGTSFRK